MAARFWVGGSGTWNASNTANWSATTGGAGGASVPTGTDTVTVDSTSGSGTITVNTNFAVVSVGVSASAITMDFTANNNSPFFGSFVFTAGTLLMGSGTFTATSTGSIFNFQGATLNSGDSTIVLTNTSNSAVNVLLSGTQVLNRVLFNRGASTGANGFTITSGGSPTVNQLTDIGTSAHTLQFQGLRSITVGNLFVRGSAGNLITIQSTSASAANLGKSPNGIVSLDYININATNPVNVASNTFYLGANSTGSGGNWVFTPPPARKLGASGAG